MPHVEVTRRTVLGALGVGAIGLGAGSRMMSFTRYGSESAPVTVDGWAGTRGSRYYIAHRGSGDVLPEHTMEAYQAAARWGARCMEISVGMTSDGVLICMHDLTYDRTTNISGVVSQLPSTVLKNTRVTIPQLGPAWMTAPLPRVPLFEHVLQAFGVKAVL